MMENKIKAIFKKSKFETGDQLQNNVHEEQGNNCSWSINQMSGLKAV